MRLGFLTTSYPRHEADCAGLFVRSMAMALAARGHRIHVLAPAPDTPWAGPHDEGITVERVRYAPAGMSRTFYGAGVPDNVRHPAAWPGLLSFPAALAARAQARVRNWDGLVSHWALPSALVAGAVRGTRPHLAVFHSADVHLLGRFPFRRRLCGHLATSATKLLFASAAHRASFLRSLPSSHEDVVGRAHACAMGIEPLPETRGRRELRQKLGFDRFTVLSLGRLVPIKGLEHAVAAVRHLAGVQLVIAGDGPERPRLEALGGARFVGHVSGLDKAELLRAADAFVLTSVPTRAGRTEGTPTSALEAAAAGLPVIASQIGGLPEVFEDGRSALFVRPGDPHGLRRAIQSLQGDHDRRMRLGRAAEAVGKRYLWSTLAPRIEALLAAD